MKKTLTSILIILNLSVFGQLDINYQIANWIFIISNNVIFPSIPDTFKIAVFGTNSQVTKNLITLATKDGKKIKDRQVLIKETNRISDLDKFNIIYLDETKNDNIVAIYDNIKGKGKLLITYKNDNKEYLMVNLLLTKPTEQFEINTANLANENIVAEEKLLAKGGSKIELQSLLDKKAKELMEKEKMLQEKEVELKNKEIELNKLNEEVEKQRKINEENLIVIANQRKELEQEKIKAQKLAEQVVYQEQILKRNHNLLASLNQEIAQKQEIIKKQNEEIQNKKQELQFQIEQIEQKQKEIEEKEKILKSKNIQIRNQQYIIFITTVFIIIFVFLSLIIWRSYKTIKRINKELEEKNIKIENQKEELQRQAYQLEQYNKELFKLSLVASKTDNSVIITDKDLKIEWINTGFTRIYGYNMQLLLAEKGETLYEISSNKEKLQQIVEQIIKDKKTKIYINEHITRYGTKIWVQTALTPILDENDEIQKFIAVESDITKLKEQEIEILQMNEELNLQKAELQAQKEKLEEYNQQIKDSIAYAMTIQNAILPVNFEVSKHFNNFVIFLPKDIVSGDFYWWHNPQPDLYFFAVVDCTGHGVPGAFMSLITSQIINQIVDVRQIYEPKEILTQINKQIIKTLSQETTNNRDGLDICLIRVIRNKDIYNISYAGAKRPLIYYDKSIGELKTIKGTRRSIGGYVGIHSKIEFEQTDITLKTNDIVYLSSDGMIDQNNPERKRFGSQQFIELLDSIKDLPLHEQKDLIIQNFENFRQNQPQRDDITIWGIKL